MLAFVYLDTQKVYSEQLPAMYTWSACEGSKEKFQQKHIILPVMEFTSVTKYV